MPPKNSQISYFSRFLLYLAFFVFFIFVFKVDILIYQTASTARRSTYGTSSNLVVGNGPGFLRDFMESWGTSRDRLLEEGEGVTMTLDQRAGSGIESKKVLMFGRVDLQIKLASGNTAGTVTTYHLSSEGQQDKIHFHFLGNSTSDTYTVHTNIFSQDKGDKEQQFVLWFDPTQDFHTYSILWNPKCIIYYVDGIPLREFKNAEHLGVPFPKIEPLRMYTGIWKAEDWATQGGRIQIDWNEGPFTTSYRRFSLDGCIWSFRTKTSSCSADDFSTKPVLTMELDQKSRERMKRVQEKYMVYDYCRDVSRFANGPGPECSMK